MKLEWSSYAIADRDEIFAFIEDNSPKAAIAVDERIAEATERLKSFPELGRAGRVFGTRELIVPRTSYLVAYRIGDRTVRILRILHGALKWPDKLLD